MCAASPDGRWVAAKDLTTDLTRLYPVAGGDPKPINGLGADEGFTWSADPKILYVARGKLKFPVGIYRLNIETGKSEPFKELSPRDMTGLCDLSHIIVSKDGKAYICGYTRLLSDLYLVKGLQ